MQHILILGTGKMARNIGLFFLRHGCAVSWISRDTSRAESFRNQLVKDVRRLAQILDKQPDDFYLHVDEISNIPQKKYDLILESIEEDLTHKREVIQTVQPLLTSGTIIASNSSSILPSQIHDSAIGLHFFYPVELTGLLEIITNQNLKDDKIRGLIDQFKSWGINPIIQNEHNAFAVNRMLLPIQAEAFRLLQAGYPADMINECSKSDHMKIGQLELMDSIGFDVLLSSIKNYVSRMNKKDQKEYQVLIEGLKKLIHDGKLGKKNKNGLMIGKSSSLNKNYGMKNKVEDFSQILNETCLRLIENKQITQNDLHIVFQNLFN